MLSPFEKKRRLFRAWSSRRPIWCAWQVTYRCNFRCRFCHYWHDPLGHANEPTVADYEKGALKLARYGTMMISLAGGEPLLRLDMPDIIRVVARHHFPFMTTNGWFITPQIARDIMKAGAWGVSVSIDYADAARHDFRRGMDGAWEQAWRAVEMLDQARIHKFQRVNVISVLMDDNIQDMETICRMAQERRAYFMVQPYGFLKTGSVAYGHNNGAVSPKLLDLQTRFRNFLSNPSYIGRFDEFLHGGITGCRAGRAFFNIDSTGDVAICVECKTRPVANLYRDNPQVIYYRLKEAARGNACKSCWYNCRGEVESLYGLRSLVRALPTYFFDRGVAE